MFNASARFFEFSGIAIVCVLSLTRSAAAEPACAPGQPARDKGAASHCQQVEERLRVDPRARRDMSPWGLPMAFAPFFESGATPAHQRLDGGYGQNNPRLK